MKGRTRRTNGRTGGKTGGKTNGKTNGRNEGGGIRIKGGRHLFGQVQLQHKQPPSLVANEDFSRGKKGVVRPASPPAVVLHT